MKLNGSNLRTARIAHADIVRGRRAAIEHDCEKGLASGVGQTRGFVILFVVTQGPVHCPPGAARPFAMVQPGPDTGNGHWDYCGGYQFSDKTTDGFSQNHLNGTGQPEMADFLLLPYCGSNVLRKSSLLKETEKASPGFYAVELGDAKVGVEITSTERVAYYRFRLPRRRRASARRSAAFPVAGKQYEKTCMLRGLADLESDRRTMTGWHEERAYWPYHLVHFAASFSVR